MTLKGMWEATKVMGVLTLVFLVAMGWVYVCYILSNGSNLGLVIALSPLVLLVWLAMAMNFSKSESEEK